MKDKQSSQSAKDIAIMKKDIEYIKDDIKIINKKLDKALDTKADKEDLEKIDTRLWQIIMAIIVAFIGIISLAIKTFIK